MRTRRLLLSFCLLGAASAQEEAPPNGPRRVDPAWHALTGATVHVSPGRTLPGATVVVRGDRIVRVSQDPPPAGARVWNLKGLHLYAGLIDAYVPVEPPAHKGRHWNKKVTPERLAREIDDETAEELRKLGFAAAVAAPRGGIFRGRASLVSLAPRDPDPSVKRPTVYREGVYQALAFERNRSARDGFPTSQMGAIALIRQSLLDGLAADQTLLFATDDELEALRAARIAQEFRRRAILLGSGTELRRLDAIRKDGLPLIVPVRFPRLPDVSSVGAQEEVDLRTLMTWEQAPTNPRRLDAAGLTVALTTHRLRRRRRFPAGLQRALRHGLEPDRALAMLTTNPAEILGVGDLMGTVERGKVANLVVTEEPLFSRDRRIRAVWIDGRHHEIEPPQGDGLPGEWRVTLSSGAPHLELSIDRRHKAKVGEKPAKRVQVRGNRVSFAFDTLTLSGTLHAETMRGHGVRASGERFTWTATRTAPPKPRPHKERKPGEVPERYGHPFGPYAREALPKQPGLLVVRAATVWTCGPQGVLRDGQIEVQRGRITYVGPRREVEGADVVDTDLHLTPGIVDCHSHTGISKGVNDSGQAVTAEVRIGDVTDPDHISWYRQLAGGVTTVNTLHGSANPIGGQNQVNKVRWGVPHPDGMHLEGAMPGIKFALGENVKQSNWGDEFTVRYPQTRMGVETLIRDRFLAAREYLAGHDRTDLELEALAEVLQGKRLVHCHSYRQDEILMLCRIAQEFGFRIGTFQHVLEGYKVAEAIKAHALGASAFSDWWAYKVEVQDAIPFNGALMHQVGVNVTFNSDSNDLARRLNVEAAKAVKYGGVKPEAALKFVTLNAAIQLGIEDRVGSLEVGKDGDFVLWSGHPLSSYTRCLATWIDGREYFSLTQDRKHREQIAAERRRIIARILGQKKEEPDDEDEEEEEERRRRRRGPVLGEEPFECGVCGCGEEER
ncbi:MAG: amidohydrolase family protein [Planctomycetota bacterium]|jgi:imidazolonepropionase-like amidohydrolase